MHTGRVKVNQIREGSRIPSDINPIHSFKYMCKTLALRKTSKHDCSVDVEGLNMMIHVHQNKLIQRMETWLAVSTTQSISYIITSAWPRRLRFLTNVLNFDHSSSSQSSSSSSKSIHPSSSSKSSIFSQSSAPNGTESSNPPKTPTFSLL